MPIIDRVTLENFRCFREKQTVKLAPLTLLVGENSTGKTSFLALIRAMAELAFGGTAPNFKTPPYDLGSFDEIAHHRGARGGRAVSFSAEIATRVSSHDFRPRPRNHEDVAIEIAVTFERRPHGTAPAPVRQCVSTGDVWLEERQDTAAGVYHAKLGTLRGQWEVSRPIDSHAASQIGTVGYYLRPFDPDWMPRRGGAAKDSLIPTNGSPPPNEADIAELSLLDSIGLTHWPSFLSAARWSDTYAEAPVRSQPHRTYNPEPWQRAPEGAHVPMRLAEMYAQELPRWEKLKRSLETFGRAAGLFDEITVRHLSKAGSDPFQIQVRKGDDRLKGPFRNLIDVGYGVSQALPVVTELLAPSTPTDLYLFQQPEVHLHPSAQAALGTLLCEVATDGRQLVVETHSDHLIDRIRMDVRDGKTKLTKDDVRILYFERDGLDVKIHELWWDDNGNIENTPPGYRRFFLQEVNRSLGL